MQWGLAHGPLWQPQDSDLAPWRHAHLHVSATRDIVRISCRPVSSFRDALLALLSNHTLAASMPDFCALRQAALPIHFFPPFRDPYAKLAFVLNLMFSWLKACVLFQKSSWIVRSEAGGRASPE
jgi:hypothetical protein